MEDTDSMAIVANKTGGLISCTGGHLHTETSEAAIQALSWEQVNGIAEKFTSLNPYDRKAITGSVLKIEEVNYDKESKDQRELKCFAISAKRYALFTVDQNGRPNWVEGKEHGLGHLLNPMEPDSEDRKWINHAWEDMILRSLGFPGKPLSFSGRPAVGRVSVSSPAVMRSFKSLNENKPFSEQIKPFNFVLTCQVNPFGHPNETDPSRFHLMAPFDYDCRNWNRMKWTDQYSGKLYLISTSLDNGTATTARVKTYEDVLDHYEYHPESKCADAFGCRCGKTTVGLLSRRHVSVRLIKFIGKESNNLENVEAGTVHSADEVYTEYRDPRRDEWQTLILPALKKLRLCDLVAKTGLSKRALMDLRAGRSRPRAGNREKLRETVGTSQEEVQQ